MDWKVRSGIVIVFIMDWTVTAIRTLLKCL